MKILYLFAILSTFSQSISASTSVNPTNELFGNWQIGNFEIYVFQDCYILSQTEKECDKSSIICYIQSQRIIPKKECYKPTISLTNRASPNLFSKPTAKMTVGDMPINSSSRRNGGEMFSLLMEMKKPEVTITAIEYKQIPDKYGFSKMQPVYQKKQKLVLVNFKEVSKNTILYLNDEKDSEINTIVLNRIIWLILLVSFLIFVIWVIKTTIPAAKKAIPNVKKTATIKVEKVKKNIETIRIRRIAEDEAIRQKIRQEINHATDDELQTLKEQIKSALDSGDTKIATNLMKILERSEQE